MFFRVNILALLMAQISVVSLSFCPESEAASLRAATAARARKARGHVSHRYRYGAYFVPPPPANMPSILPELAVKGSTAVAVEAKKPVNPYKKYIYSRDGYETPAPVQVRKGVTTWSRSS